MNSKEIKFGTGVDIDIVTNKDDDDSSIGGFESIFSTGVSGSFNLFEDNITINITEEVEMSIKTSKLIDIINKIFGLNKNIVYNISRKTDEVLSFISERLSQEYNINIDMNSLYNECNSIKNFINLVSIGVVVGKGYEKVIPCNFKIFYLNRNDDDSIYVQETTLGAVWKGIPVIESFTKSEFNAVSSKFYKGQDYSNISNGDYFSYFINTIVDTNSLAVSDGGPEINIDSLSDLELAKMIVDRGFDREFMRNLFSKKVISASRKEKIAVLLNILS